MKNYSAVQYLVYLTNYILNLKHLCPGLNAATMILQILRFFVSVANVTNFVFFRLTLLDLQKLAASAIFRHDVTKFTILC